MRSALTVMVGLGLVALASDSAQAFPDKSHEGKVVEVVAGSEGAAGTLVMTDNDGNNEHSHDIAATVKITVDGKPAKLTDLKKGDKIKVSTDDDMKVTAVAATREKKPAK